MTVQTKVILWLVCLAIAAQLVAFIFYAVDKRRAVKGKTTERLPESVLWFWSFVGPLGSWLAIYRLRHKNRKWTFLCITWPLIVLGVAAYAMVIWYCWL